MVLKNEWHFKTGLINVVVVVVIIIIINIIIIPVIVVAIVVLFFNAGSLRQSDKQYLKW